MSENDDIIKELVGVFKESIDHSKNQSEAMNLRMDQLALNQIETNKQQAETSKQIQHLSEVIARSEQRHEKTTDDVDRIETLTKSLGKEFKLYKQSNDDRVMDVEKQNLLLGKDYQTLDDGLEKSRKPWDNFTKIVIGTVTAVITALVLYFMVSKK